MELNMNKNPIKIFSMYTLFLLFYTMTITPMDLMDYSTDDETDRTTEVNRMAFSSLLNPVGTTEGEYGEYLDDTDLVTDEPNNRPKRSYDTIATETYESNKRSKNVDSCFRYACDCGKSFSHKNKYDLVYSYRRHCLNHCKQKKMTEKEFNSSEKSKVLNYLNGFDTGNNSFFIYACDCGRSFFYKNKYGLVHSYKNHCVNRCEQKRMTADEFDLTEKPKVYENLNSQT